MVDFRYHLVSIMAVFLALALGIVIGTTRLNGYVLDNLRGSIGALTNEKRGLETTVSDLRRQGTSDQDLVNRVGPLAVAGQLSGVRVVLLDAPGVSGTTGEQLVPLLEAAGATVSGTVQLRADLLDPAKAKQLDEVVTRVAPQGIDLTGDEPVERASVELAAALLRPATGTGGITSTAADTVLAGLRDAGLISTASGSGSGSGSGTGPGSGRADLAVLLTGDPLVSSDPAAPAARARGLLSLAAALDAAGSGALIAGTANGLQPGGVLKALRDDDALSARVSSVDEVDRPQGRVASVFALVEQQAGGSGNYGSGAGSEAAAPSLPVK